MLLITLILSIFTVALITPWVQRRYGASWLMSLVPASIFFWLISQFNQVSTGASLEEVYPWVPSLGVEFALRLDGLSMLFALLITGIGALVVVYSHFYLKNQPDLGRFQTFILLFMGSMLGVVLADDVITLFIFWELTSATSYLLIGFKNDYEKARYGALKALLITAIGGLALLLGLLLMGKAAGTYRISELAAAAGVLQAHALYLPVLLLVLAGAFTKSAQVPFHIWLPDAMQAPTPASSYLHSATMVKAGVYLLARLHSTLGGTEHWLYIVGITGSITMLLGAYLAFKQTDLKALLAYSTISALGLLVTLIGIGSPLAIKAAMLGILAHALYKGTLFLVTGIVDHATGTRELPELGGLMRLMPVSATLAIIATLSMAGIPPLLGFIAKEVFFEATLDTRLFVTIEWLIPAIAVATAILAVAYSILLVHGTFMGTKKPTPKTAHEGHWGMLAGPAVLATLSILLTMPFFREYAATLIASSSTAVLAKTVEVKLKLWHGFNLPLLLSVTAVAGGFLLYLLRLPIWRIQSVVFSRARLDAVYDAGVAGLMRFAVGLTRKLQTGTLRHYLMIILITLVGLVSFTLLNSGTRPQIPFSLGEIYFYEIAAAFVMAIAAIMVVISSSRLGAIASLGTVGFLMALFFILYSGPDLAFTQLLVETLSVLLLLVVFYFLPTFFEERTTPKGRLRDVSIAAGVGTMITLLVLIALPVEFSPSISYYFYENSLTLAYGTNVVNVILVDFRALDTLGEIGVLAIAAISAFGLIKLRPKVKPATVEKTQ